MEAMDEMDGAMEPGNAVMEAMDPAADAQMVVDMEGVEGQMEGAKGQMEGAEGQMEAVDEADEEEQEPEQVIFDVTQELRKQKPS